MISHGFPQITVAPLRKEGGNASVSGEMQAKVFEVVGLGRIGSAVEVARASKLPEIALLVADEVPEIIERLDTTLNPIELKCAQDYCMYILLLKQTLALVDELAQPDQVIVRQIMEGDLGLEAFGILVLEESVEAQVGEEAAKLLLARRKKLELIRECMRHACRFLGHEEHISQLLRQTGFRSVLSEDAITGKLSMRLHAIHEIIEQLFLDPKVLSQIESEYKNRNSEKV